MRDSDSSVSQSEWAGPDGPLGTYISREVEKTLRSYREQPRRLIEDFNTEDYLAKGGYADRQLFELVQNSADSLAERQGGGRIRIRLSRDYLYCADEGLPIDKDGVTALMFARMSPKKGTNQIGRFGLGFKSVLGVTDRPEFFSRSGSFCFDVVEARKRIKANVPDAGAFPVLRLPRPVHPQVGFNNDPVLQRLASWATNIVRLPLKRGAHESLAEQIESFPQELLLFVEHVQHMMFDTDEFNCVLSLRKEGEQYLLSKNEDTRPWRLFNKYHELSDDALEDRRSVDDTGRILITWAVPLDQIGNPGSFWTFFPTKTRSLTAGILNAPWKTNEDRQNLLEGVYNKELINTAAGLIADSLSQLSTKNDPALHLDALPRRKEESDSNLTSLLRRRLFQELIKCEIVPDQDGNLHKIKQINYPPRKLERTVLENWASYQGRPLNWLHHTAKSIRRLAAIDKIFDGTDGRYRNRYSLLSYNKSKSRESSISEWLEALTEDACSESELVQASMAAIQTAALIPIDQHNECIGKIVLSANLEWRTLESDSIFLKGTHDTLNDNVVHPQLEADGKTLKALKQLGLGYISPKKDFKMKVENLYINREWEQLWELSRSENLSLWKKTIQGQREWRFSLRVLTLSSSWQILSKVLLPGSIVPKDGHRDKDITVDTNFHSEDLDLLSSLGVLDQPQSQYKYNELDPPGYKEYKRDCFKLYRQKGWNPLQAYMEFKSYETTGPLNIIHLLSEEGKALYTESLLDKESTFRTWTMYHMTRSEKYPTMEFNSPAVRQLLKEGRVRLAHGAILKLSEGIGENSLPEVRRWLLEHPNSTLINEVFDIRIEPNIDLIGDIEPQPLVDEWPGLREHLTRNYRATDLNLVRCERVGFDSSGYELDCYIEDNSIYLLRRDNEGEELRVVLRELGITLSEEEIERILERQTHYDVDLARASVRSKASEAERLLEAIGEDKLREGVPWALRKILDAEGASPLETAEAAIATYDVGTLHEYRDYLSRYDPPSQWAGGMREVEFVQSLGFGIEWAGERQKKRPPYEEVSGPYKLPRLHDFQRSVANNLRNMLSSGEPGAKRGLISMPTGSGKTRVAVQAVVEAITKREYTGDVLWVADRDELCEQAVTAWRQVWSNLGFESTMLRISRLWGGHRNPTPTTENAQHVIVASIQTLNSRIIKRTYQDGFLEKLNLVIFDEAHRSIAPTFTQVMEKLGLTYIHREDEPYLLGLTATPYRGHNEEETRRLVRRYRNNRLDAGAFLSDDPESVTIELQNKGVLAQADREIIEGGTFFLPEEEALERQRKRIPWLPTWLEKDIGDNLDRTRRIIEAYEKHIRDNEWPTLIFATSVDHAKTLVALLNRSGVVSRSVDGETRRATRRKIVEGFRAGDIQVLVNYGVLQEGFDAPKTRAIVVARPVYSPNLYFQMIGRGLRGPRNGGNERCLILNVEDNIVNFKEELAFTELEWLWAKGGGNGE